MEMAFGRLGLIFGGIKVDRFTGVRIHWWDLEWIKNSN